MAWGVCRELAPGRDGGLACWADTPAGQSSIAVKVAAEPVDSLRTAAQTWVGQPWLRTAPDWPTQRHRRGSRPGGIAGCSPLLPCGVVAPWTRHAVSHSQPARGAE